MSNYCDKGHWEAQMTLLERMHDAWQGLKACGWKETIYCPKDGTRFLAIDAGSTGVFPCYYSGEWPKGSWWAEAHGDLWPARPILWKPMPSNVELSGGAQEQPRSAAGSPSLERRVMPHVATEERMAITIKHDGSGAGDVQENCCKCGKPTRYWFGTGGRNVALCEMCAPMYEEGDLPTKAEWIAAERARNPRPFWTAR